MKFLEKFFLLITLMVLFSLNCLAQEAGAVDQNYIAKYSPYAVFLVMVLDFIIGNIKTIKPNSVIDVLLHTLIKILRAVFRIDENAPKKE